MRFIRMKEVIHKTGKKKSAIYKDMAAGTFPNSVPSGGRARSWVEGEIDQWLLDRIKARDEDEDKSGDGE